MLHLLLAVAVIAAPGKHRQKIAVLEVEDVSGNEAAKAHLLTQVIAGDVSNAQKFDVMSPSDIKNMIGFEKQKQLLGCKEDSCLAELGGALGVDFLVSGQLGKLGSRYRLDVRLLDAAHSRVIASEGDFIPGNDDALADAAEKMVHKLLADGGLVDKDAPSLAAPAGGLAQPAPTSSGPRPVAYLTAGGAVVLSVLAVLTTINAATRFKNDQACYQGHPPTPLAPGQNCADVYSPDNTSHLADGLWIGTLALTGVSTYLLVSGPSSSGAGGEVGLRGNF